LRNVSSKTINQPRQKQNIAFVLSPEEFTALSELCPCSQFYDPVGVLLLALPSRCLGYGQLLCSD
jgi:hypothetical protein